MCLALLTATLTCSLSLYSAVPVTRETPGYEPGYEPGGTLLEAVEASLTVLTDILRRTQGNNQRVLRVQFALDTDGQLVAQVLLLVRAMEQPSFHEWGGPVYSAGWVPRQRVLVDTAEIVEAERLWALGPARDVLWQALAKAVQEVRGARPADVVLSAVPSMRGGNKAVDLFVGRAGRARGIVFDPSTRTFTEASVAAPGRVPVDVRSLPVLEVPEGQWFNTEKPPTLAGLRGRPVLLLVTSPG